MSKRMNAQFWDYTKIVSRQHLPPLFSTIATTSSQSQNPFDDVNLPLVDFTDSSRIFNISQDLEDGDKYRNNILESGPDGQQSGQA